MFQGYVKIGTSEYEQTLYESILKVYIFLTCKDKMIIIFYTITNTKTALFRVNDFPLTQVFLTRNQII